MAIPSVDGQCVGYLLTALGKYTDTGSDTDITASQLLSQILISEDKKGFSLKILEGICDTLSVSLMESGEFYDHIEQHKLEDLSSRAGP